LRAAAASHKLCFMQDPAEVASALGEIAALLGLSGEARFKIKAYEHAARVTETLGDELGLLVEQDRLRSLQGIGAVLSRQIHELWNTGTSELLLRLRREHPEGAAQLVRVQGMTPRRIRALHAALGVRSVDELREACLAGKVRSVPGFGVKTEQRLLAASERWLGRGPAAPRRLILAHALELAELLQRELVELAGEAHIAGALRRGEETLAELEFVVARERAAALDRLARLRQVVRVDHATSTAHLSDGIPLVLHSSEPAPGNALLFATGSAAHVEALCARAESRAFTLAAPSEPRAAVATVTLPVQRAPASALGRPALPARSFATERDLYAALGMAFVPAELRSGAGEVERAQHDDFSELVELGDIQGLVHCHTTYSDGKNGVLEMALAAHALGMKYITITDHSPSAHYAGGVSLDQLQRQWDDIADAQARVPIRILRGTESDILIDGRLDYPDDVLERFDIVIASIHARHRLDRTRMTERLVRALSLPVFKIWGHGLGRILGHRPPVDCDVPAVLDALARSRGAIELNADPHRLDLPAAFIPAARERGIPFVISVDAHSTHGFGVLRHGVTQARRGGLSRADVLNTRPADEFAALVRPV
jgi:DNA polymerase (family 10)